MERPNLLFLYTDEQAFNTMAAYGNDQIEMPNLNKLARQSVVFDQTYVTQPVCTPSRSTLLTGLYPHTNGCTENNIPLQPETACLPEMITKGEYRTAHFGKWHLGDELFAQHGFEEWVSIEDCYNNYFTEGRDRDVRSSYHHFLIDNGFTPGNGERFGRGEAARLPEEYSKPAFLARESCSFLEKNRDNPFILYVNFLEPHMPFFGPRDDQYNPEDIPLPDNFEAGLSDSQPLKARVYAEGYKEWGHSGLSLKTPEDWKRMIAHYWGLCSLVDTYVGKILDSLDEYRLSENTIVVFTSDHGDMMGSHQLLAKTVMFEEAVKVPFMMRLPGQTQGKRVTGPVSQIDAVPTLLDLMGQPVPANLQGESLAGLIKEDDPVSEDNVFVEWNGPNSGIVGEGKGNYRVPFSMKGDITSDDIKKAVNASVRSIVTPDGWKFNYSTRGEYELYNLYEDPGETQNLFSRPEYSEIVKGLIKSIEQWQRETGDSVDFSN